MIFPKPGKKLFIKLVSQKCSSQHISKTLEQNPSLLKFILIKIRNMISKFNINFIGTKSGKVALMLLFLLGYTLFRYYNASYEILCSKKNRENLKILRHLKPRLKKYNPTFYVLHPMISVILGDSVLDDNYIIKFKKEVKNFINFYNTFNIFLLTIFHLPVLFLNYTKTI